MDKRGSFITWGIYIILLVAVIIGLMMQSNPNLSKESIVGNISEHFVWEEITPKNETDNVIVKVVYLAVNFLGEAFFAIVPSVAEWAANNPEMNWKLIMYGVILAIVAPLIIPLVYLIAIIVMLIRELIITRREKKEAKSES